MDGNKRIGLLVMMTFLEMNGIILECSNEELIELGLGLASNKLDETFNFNCGYKLVRSVMELFNLKSF